MKDLKLLSFLFFLPFLAQAQQIYTVAGGGTEWHNCPATNASLPEPYGVALDDSGSLLIRENALYRVMKVKPALHGIITSFAGNGIGGFSGDGFPAVAASLNSGSWVYIGHRGDMYISDVNRLRKVTANGIIRTIAGTGVGGYNGDGIPATSAQVNIVRGVVVDDTGSVYFVDGENLRIRKIDTFGIITTIAGTGATGFSPDGSKADTCRLTYIFSLAIDKNNDLYFFDDYRIRKISSGTNIVSTLAGTGVSGFSGDGGSATIAQFTACGIAIDTFGNLFLADVSNHRIRKLDKEGNINTIAGTGIAGFFGDGGNATAAKLRFPQMVAVNKEGDIFFSDGGNQRVRVITDKPLGIAMNQSEIKTGVRVVPNPVPGKHCVTIMSPHTEEAILIITDTQGKEIVRNKTLTNTQVDLPNSISTGVYFTTIILGSQQYREKLILQ